jgi:glyoxylase-like metal-dependent hydrolase (beta-lactamase superfamily II)
MKTTPIQEFGLQLTRFGFVNCYLVREPGGPGEPESFTLIDTLVSGSAEWICSVATEKMIPIRRILLTHAHGDHVGSVDAITAQVLDVEVAANRRALPLLQQPPDLSLEPGEAPGKIKGATPGIKSPVTHIVNAGERYGSLLAIDTPGHIPGHQSFLDERDGTLYAGDAILTLAGLVVAGYASGWKSIFNNFTWNKEVALASAHHLLDFPIERIASGHGPVREGGKKLLETTLAQLV